MLTGAIACHHTRRAALGSSSSGAAASNGASTLMNADLSNAIIAAWPELSALGVEHLDVFGSAARGTNGPGSDIDVLVHLRPPATLRALVDIRDHLIRVLQRPVDLLTPGALAQRPRLLERVLSEAVRVA